MLTWTIAIEILKKAINWRVLSYIFHKENYDKCEEIQTKILGKFLSFKELFWKLNLKRIPNGIKYGNYTGLYKRKGPKYRQSTGFQKYNSVKQFICLVVL